jgi:hypothetical protein
MKTCTKCKVEKELTDFAKSKDKIMSWCKSCTNIRNRERYKNDPKHKANIQKHTSSYQERNRQFVIDYLNQHPCPCGQTNILTLQFDHLSDKEWNISAKIHDCSLENLKKELDKCQVLCANCHSIKTAHQLGNWKLKWLARRD